MIKSFLKALLLVHVLVSANATIEAVDVALHEDTIELDNYTNYQKAIIVFIKG